MNAMLTSPRWVRALAAAMAWLCVAGMLLVAACGGGVGSGGSGTGLSSYAEGVVSGFGSVIVDGTEYTDTQAAVQAEDASGTKVNTDIKLGQRVLVTADSSNAASAIQVLPQLIGPAQSGVDATGWLRVSLQGVQVVSAASATASRPATLLGGYSSASAIQAGDDLEVHGNWALDETRKTWVLVATRIDKLDTAPAHVLISGIVLALPGNQTVRLNTADGTLVQASSLPVDLQTGQLVSAWVARSSLASTPVQATRMGLSGVGALGASSSDIKVSGLASDFDASTNTVSVQGMRVSLPANLSASSGAVTSGALLTVRGKGDGRRLQATNASSSATQPGSTPPTELKGAVSGVNWSASAVSFSLRDTTVSASATAIDRSCTQLASTAEAYVEVLGTITPPSTTLVAIQVKCSSTTPVGATVKRTGMLQSADTSTLVLQTGASTLEMAVDGNTYFEQPPASLIGKSVDVEGVLITGNVTLRAKAVRRAH